MSQRKIVTFSEDEGKPPQPMPGGNEPETNDDGTGGTGTEICAEDEGRPPQPI